MHCRPFAIMSCFGFLLTSYSLPSGLADSIAAATATPTSEATSEPALKPVANGPQPGASKAQNIASATPLKIDCELKIERRQAEAWAVITFTNRMKQPAPLWKRNLFMEGRVSFDAFQVTRDGTNIPYRGALAKRSPPADQDLFRLQAGQSYTARFRLNDHYAVTTPGHYSVVYLVFDGYARGYKLTELRSNTANFEVK
jgi:hypothetical protein